MNSFTHPKCSLIISTYNWPEALQVCLLSVLQQSWLPAEVIIADDGSTSDTGELIDQLRSQFPIPLVHIWQPDAGFQLARIRNKAIAAARFEYLIQIDGDLILHPHFIRDHLQFSEPGNFITGSRCMLDSELSRKIIREKKASVSVFAKGVKNKLNGLRIPFLAKRFTHYREEDIYYLRGCNMAFWKQDIVQINGYNEAFVGWGCEDNDIVVRLINIGLKKKTIKYSGIVFHIYHPENRRDDLKTNEALLQETLAKKTTFIEQGMNQYKHLL